MLNPFGSNLRELCQPAADQMPFLMSTFPLSPFLQPDTPGTFNPRRKLVLDQPETTQNPLLLEDYENGDIHVPETPQQHYQALNKTTSQNSPGLHPQQRAQHRLSQVRQYRNYNKRATYHPPANRQRPHHNQQTQDLPADVRDDITRPSPTKILNRSFGPLVREINKQSAAALSSTVGFASIEESACLNHAEDVCNISNQISTLQSSVQMITSDSAAAGVLKPPAANDEPPAASIPTADGASPPAVEMEPPAAMTHIAGILPPAAITIDAENLSPATNTGTLPPAINAGIMSPVTNAGTLTPASNVYTDPKDIRATRAQAKKIKNRV